MTPQERYWAKVKQNGPDECWPWKASLTIHGGYGQFNPTRKRTVRAHRYGYELAHGPIPAGLTVDHLCGNKSCQNPTHMELVTHGENARRGNAGRSSDVCRNGHRRTPANTARWSRGDGTYYQVCRTCANAAQRRRRAARAA